LNEYLINATYTPVHNWNSLYNGPDIITIIVQDGGNNVAIGYIDIIANPINDLPVITAPLELWVYEDAKYTFTNISISDVDAEETFMALLEVIISCEHGTFYVPTMSGIYVKETNETAKNKIIILQGSE
jgi:hypothetical protein